MKIDLAKLGPFDSWLHTLVFDLMTHHTTNAGDWDKVFNLTPGMVVGNTSCEIKVSINDVELDFKHFIKSLEKNYDKMLGEKAKELIDENFGNLISTLDKMSEEAKEKLSYDVLPSYSYAKNKKE